MFCMISTIYTQCHDVLISIVLRTSLHITLIFLMSLFNISGIRSLTDFIFNIGPEKEVQRFKIGQFWQPLIFHAIVEHIFLESTFEMLQTS